MGKGKDPLENHKLIAKILGEDIDAEQFEKVGWAKKKRSIDSDKSFSTVSPHMSDIKMEEYKSSVHTPNVFDAPEGVDKSRFLDEFQDQELDFIKHTEAESFDSEMNAAIRSRMAKIKRKKQHAESPKSYRAYYSDEEADMDVRLSKHQKNLETANRLQQNIIDMEITKKDDEEFKALLEKENIIDPIGDCK